MMAKSPDFFSEHGIWNLLQELEDKLTSANALLVEGHDPDAHMANHSLSQLVIHVRTRLNQTNPIIISPHTLDDLERSFQPVVIKLDAFIVDEHAQHIIDGWTESYEVLSTVAALPAVISADDVGNVADTISAFHLRATTELDNVRERAGIALSDLDEVRQQLGALSSEVAQQGESISTALSDFVIKSEQDRTDQATKFNDALVEMSNARTSFEQSTVAEQSIAKTANEQLLGTLRAEFDELVAAWSTRADENHEQQTQEAQDALDEIRSQLDTAQGLVEMIGEVTMTGHYQKNAIEQRKSADQWRWATVVAGTLAVISAVLLTYTELNGNRDYSWLSILGRSTVTLSLIALAAFLANQSLNHRRREEEYRALELELATLDPFLNSLDEEERKKIKADLSMRYFKGVEKEHVDLDNPSGGSARKR